jgi:probable F420-dependent oxidoreductase
MARIGVAFSGGGTASDIVDCVKLAEDRGYESAWVTEGHGGDQFAVLSGCAVATSTIKLGTAISSVFVRSAPTIAMAAATVDDLSGGRFILGLGSSHKVQVEPEHGVPFGKPIIRVRETVDVVRQLLAEGSVSYDGETIKIEKFDLWFKPHRPSLPVYLAGLFPKMASVCGEIADGIILTRSTMETATEIRRNLAEGAAKAGRNVAKIEVTSLLPTAVADSRAEAMEMMRPGLALYVGFFPRYNKLIASHGFEEEAADIAAAFQRGDMEGATRAVSDAMVDATSVCGTPVQCRERIDAYRDSGIDLPIISPFVRGGDARKRFAAAIQACVEE